MALNTRRETIISLSLATVIVVGAGIYLSRHIDAFAALDSLSSEQVAVLLSVTLPMLAVHGMYYQIVLKIYKKGMSVKEWLALAFGGLFISYILPFRGGVGLRALYLKYVHALSITVLLSYVISIQILTSILFCVLGLISLAVLYLTGIPIRIDGIYILTISFIVLMTLFLMPAVFPITWISKYPILSQVAKGWRGLIKCPGLLLKILMVSFVFSLLSIAVVYLSFNHLGIPLGPLKSVVVASFESLTFFMRFTPGGLGFSEGAMVYSASLFHLDPARCLIAAGLRRASIMVWLFTIGPIAAIWLIRRGAIKISEIGSVGSIISESGRNGDGAKRCVE